MSKGVVLPPASFEMERNGSSSSLATAAALLTLAALAWLPAASASLVKLPWYNTPSPSAGWKQAHATFYGDETAQETMGGACGYGNLYNSGYGTMTAALSSVLFTNGYGCGQCFEIQCTGSKYCFPGSITVTATNLCPANWYKPTDNGGWCNPPRAHFDLSKPAFMRIAIWKAGIVPVSYRRVQCQRKGQINFKLEGNKWWLIVFITNVGGSGDIKSMSVKGDKTGWIPMTRNWGVGFQVFKQLQGQSLSFQVTCFSTGKTTIISNVVPSNWQTGQTYSGGQLSS